MALVPVASRTSGTRAARALSFEDAEDPGHSDLGDPSHRGTPSFQDTFTEDPEEQHDQVALLGNPSTLQLKLKMLAPRKPPAIPEKPAPPVAPPHTSKAPVYLITPARKETQIMRKLNSTVGRGCTFMLTTVIYIFCAFGVVEFQEPTRRLHGEHYPWLIATLVGVTLMFACLPILSEKAGMHPHSTGWKPYLVIYRCAYIIAVPALACLGLGFGSELGFGEAEGPSGQISVTELEPSSGRYFEASDGFVALNLTLGITETLRRTNHGIDGGVRTSRFRDAELLINREPFTGLTEPTVPPGRQKLIVIAPVFARWANCVSRYKVSASCLTNNAVIAWAMAEARSLCSDLHALACRATEPKLEPVYRCSTQPRYGRTEEGSIMGLCGRVILPPQGPVIDELSALLLADGWPINTMPNSSQPWLDVTPDECISKPQECKNTWKLRGDLGVGFSIIVVLCILIPACLDQKADRQIREVREYWEAKEQRELSKAGLG